VQTIDVNIEGAIPAEDMQRLKRYTIVASHCGIQQHILWTTVNQTLLYRKEDEYMINLYAMFSWFGMGKDVDMNKLTANDYYKRLKLIAMS
jgi:hypothetical protein